LITGSFRIQIINQRPPPHPDSPPVQGPAPWHFSPGRRDPILDSPDHLPLAWTASTTGGDAAAVADYLVLAVFLARCCPGDEAPEEARENARLDLPALRQGPPRRLLLLRPPLHRRRGCLLAQEGTEIWGLKSRVLCCVVSDVRGWSDTGRRRLCIFIAVDEMRALGRVGAKLPWGARTKELPRSLKTSGISLGLHLSVEHVLIPKEASNSAACVKPFSQAMFR